MEKEYTVEEVLQGLEAHTRSINIERCKTDCPMSAANGGGCATALCKNAARIIKNLKDNYTNMRDNFESLQKEHARQTEEYNRKLTAARDRIRNLTDVNAELTATCARKDEKIERLKKDNKTMLERNSYLSTCVLMSEGLKQPKPTVSAQIHKAINAFTMEHCGCKRPSKVIINRSCFEALEAEIKPFVRDWEAVKTVKLFEGIPVEVVESDKNEKPRFSLSYDYRTFDVE